MYSEKRSSSKVIIVGGGLSGVLLAINLCQLSDAPRILLVEKDHEKLGRGNAYQNEFTHQPLNVVAGAMSIYEHIPDDFLRWLQTNQFRYGNLISGIEETSFVPRKLFGDYLSERLKEALDAHADRLQIVIDEVLSIQSTGTGNKVVLASGAEHNASDVVLALGNFPPADLNTLTESAKKSPYYISNPWTSNLYASIGMRDRILLVGSSLTAIDIALGLYTRLFEGHITMLSRKGKLPSVQVISAQRFSWNLPYLLSPFELARLLRRTIRENRDIHWTAIVDSLRPFSQQIWAYWSLAEKRLFLARLRPFWETARHRIPTETAEVLDRLQNQNRLTVVKGEVLKLEEIDDGFEALYRNGFRGETGFFNKVINCTGPESNYRNIQTPVVNSLINEKKVVADSLGLGILCDPEGRILNDLGEVSKGLWCIGPMRKAILWETTALREIRKQARDLARLLGKTQTDDC